MMATFFFRNYFLNSNNVFVLLYFPSLVLFKDAWGVNKPAKIKGGVNERGAVRNRRGVSGERRLASRTLVPLIKTAYSCLPTTTHNAPGRGARSRMMSSGCGRRAEAVVGEVLLLSSGSLQASE